MTIPVLMFHHVLPKEGFIASSIDNFDKQMKYLYENGWRTLTSEEFYLYKKQQIKLPKKSLLITFDDGWRDNFVYAYPILKKYGLKATLFVVTEWIEKASIDEECVYENSSHSECKRIVPSNPRKVVCNWEELKNMKDVFDIHSHTHTHRDEYFSKISWIEDLKLSKESIKNNLGFDDKFLCWPRGIYDNELIKFASEEKFDMLFTTKRGINLSDNNLKEIKRVSVKKDDKWLKKNLFIFSNPFLGKIYSWIKPE